MRKCVVRIARADFDGLMRHLFPGDGDEHGAVLLAGYVNNGEHSALCVREIHPAREGIDYVKGNVGYRALAPTFIHRMITRARDERLIYLAAHNHDSDTSVGFSRIDLESHDRGYPALLQIARGMPVGALVHGHRSMEADIWFPDGTRGRLDHAAVIGSGVLRVSPQPDSEEPHSSESYDRQVRWFGRSGQRQLARSHVGIIGLGGIGSLVAEYLAHLGIGRFTLVDPDRVETSNLSRIVGASRDDAAGEVAKVKIAARCIRNANPDAHIESRIDDVAKESVARSLIGCDYLFLAADSMRARLVFNAIIHQYLIPGVQLGSKIHSGANGRLSDVMSANRPVRPGEGCLWCNQLIDPTLLAKEAKTDDERRAQEYGTEQPNPSVITLNAVAAAHAVNDFLLDYLGLRPERAPLHYEHFHFLKNSRMLVEPRKDANCPECSRNGRFGRGDGVPLPSIDG